LNSVLRETQKTFLALNLTDFSFTPTIDDSANLLRLKISEAESDSSFSFAASTYDMENQMIKDDIHTQGKRVITFSHILNHNTFPLAEILDTILEIGHKEMGTPIEIEFAVNLDTPEGLPKVFSFLQIRPIVSNEQRITFKIEKVNTEETIVYSQSALGNGIIDNINDLVYIKPDSFKSSDKKLIAKEI
jgi:hypothetical protein